MMNDLTCPPIDVFRSSELDPDCPTPLASVPRVFAVGVFAALSFTAGHLEPHHTLSELPIELAWTGGVSGTAEPSPAQMLQELHDRADASWEEVGKWFGVSRRAVHYWLESGQMKSVNRVHLDKLWNLAQSSISGSELHVRLTELSSVAGRGTDLAQRAGPAQIDEAVDYGERVFVVDLA